MSDNHANPTITAASIRAIFNTAVCCYHQEFFDWCFDTKRKPNYPCYTSDRTDKRTNGELYLEWLLTTWNSQFNISPSDQYEIRKYLEGILLGEEENEEMVIPDKEEEEEKQGDTHQEF